MGGRVHAPTIESRALFLLPAGALLVHQLRYLLAYGPDAGGALSAQGHAYLGSIEPWVVVLLAVGLGAFVRRVSRALTRAGRGMPRLTRPLTLWTVIVASLVAVYAVQESLEGLLAGGHPAGLTGIFGGGGWWAIVAAAAVAALIVALLRVADVIVAVAARVARGARRRRESGAPARPCSARLLRLAPLAYPAAGRAPPLLVGCE
jgi:hypothetical protein